MAKLGNPVEPAFMNQLSFTVRPAAIDLYRHISLKQLLEVRHHQVPPGLVQKYGLTAEQWQAASEAVILTRLSQFQLSAHLSNACVNRLKQIVAGLLGASETDLAEVIAGLENEDAGIMADWLRKLERLKVRS